MLHCIMLSIFENIKNFFLPTFKDFTLLEDDEWVEFKFSFNFRRFRKRIMLSSKKYISTRTTTLITYEKTHSERKRINDDEGASKVGCCSHMNLITINCILKVTRYCVKCSCIINKLFIISFNNFFHKFLCSFLSHA